MRTKKRPLPVDAFSPEELSWARKMAQAVLISVQDMEDAFGRKDREGYEEALGSALEDAETFLRLENR